MAEIVNSAAAEVKTAAEQIPSENPVEATNPEKVVKVAEADTKQVISPEKAAGKVIDIFDGADDTRQEWEKPLAEIEAAQKAEKQKGKQAAKAAKEKTSDKQKPDKAAKAPKKEPTAKTVPVPEPPKEPEKPAEPVAAPRSGEVEQIVHLKITELHAFKNHPFEVRDDEEMRAMVASVKDSLAAQAERLQQYAKQNGYIVVGVLSEYGNGLSLDRPALVEVTQAVCAGQVDTVMVHNISRIGRGWRLVQEYIDLLTKHNVTLLCVTDGLEISNRTLYPFCKG